MRRILFSLFLCWTTKAWAQMDSATILALSKQEALVQVQQHPDIFSQMTPMFQADKEIVLQAVTRLPSNATYVHASLWEDRKLVEDLLSQNIEVFRYLPDTLQHDRSLLQYAIQKDSLAVLHIPSEYRDDDNLMKLAVRRNSLAYNFVSDRLKADRYTASLALVDAKPEIWRAVPESLKQDDEFLTPLILRNCSLLQFALHDQIEVVRSCANRDVSSFQYAVPSIRNNTLLLRDLLRTKPELLQYAGEDVRNDKEFILSLLPEYRIKPSFIGMKLQRDPDVAVAFLETDPALYRLFSEELRNDEQVSRLAIQQSLLLFEFVGEELKDDDFFVGEVVQQNGSLIRFASERIRGDKDIARIAVLQDPKAFDELTTSLQDDLLWVDELLGEYPDKISNYHSVLAEKEWGIGKVPLLFRYDRLLVEEAMQVRGISLEKAPKHFQADEKIVRLAVEQNGMALAFASEELRNNEKVANVALKQNPQAILFVGPSLREDERFIKKTKKKYPSITRYLREEGE